ncbi:glucose transporter GlcP-like [Diorhabda carinulata]|uniref:glucose transporter GlcP-like n=1 Tax=Diorhabda carinulata TaxID=1163345 RepID=UPI0025A06BD9|nr:glucose transporter GlcP-like [Diorhabda carinulata]XP_057653844.1 glucose transporter GlcP-like [Diorhabda carinulata]XP_057653845.1 glucose transporter GlcP-like [Diorhabda carinulata]XP_057653847.1 glucose transporter GlcP-like [Diorhabda carinulata]XP_057653848.1 glucose transporter GlcP-like [Diorhabda carinulata]XP_057653849.1 glucose transporter GlcP-like [Diorhabda carinulata]
MGNPIPDVEFAKQFEISTKKWWQIPYYMYFCGFTANLMIVSLGMNIAWISPSLGKLQSNDTHINPLGSPITTLQTSLVTAIPYLIAILTNGVWAKLLDKLGRKRTMQLGAIILTCSLLGTAFAANISILFVSLIISGMCVNGGIISASVYNNDIADDSNRGTLGCLLALNLPIGLVLCYFFGSITSIKYLSLICTIPSIFILLLSPFICESPVHLVRNSKITEAIEALEKLKQTKDSEVIDNEIKKIKDNIEVMSSCRRKTFLDIFRNRATRKAVVLCYQLFCIEQFSGISPVLAFVGTTFNKAGLVWSGDTVGIVVGLTKFLATLVALYCIDRTGRRRLLLVSSLSCTFSLLLLGFSFYIKYIKSPLLDGAPLLPVALITIFIIVHSVGLGSVPLTYAGELFPNDARATGVSFVIALQQINLCLVNFTFPILSDIIGEHWCFWINAMASLTGFISIYFTIPETKGKAFSEIQNMLLKKQ